jgi:hypothetical protein
MANRQLVLQVVQPALARFMDGSVSTLAPPFATAVATRDARTTFMAGLAAPLVPASQMAFAEALSDDGPITGRGDPWLRGLVEGVATLLGGLAHALPFLLPRLRAARRLRARSLPSNCWSFPGFASASICASAAPCCRWWPAERSS